MSKEIKINTVKQLYAAVAARDLETVFNALTDDIRWEPPFVSEIPHTRLRTGKAGVKDWVIEMASELTYTQVSPQAIYADNDAVIVKGYFEGKANNTGKAFASDWVHIWKFRDDRIYSYQAFWNTCNVANAMK